MDATEEDPGAQEVQSISLPTGAIGGYWTLNGINFAYNATVDDVNLGGITVTGGSGGFTFTWNDVGPQSLFGVDTSGLQFGGGVTEDVEGADPSDPGTQEAQSISLPSGATGGTWSIGGQSLAYNANASAVEGAVETATGLSVTVSGSGGSFGVTWNAVGPQSLLSVNISGLTFSPVTETTAGAFQTSDGSQEVQSIVFSPDAIGGTWTINGETLAFDADADDVEGAIETATGQSVTVTGSAGSFGVTWNAVGPQDLLTVDTSGLEFPAPIVEDTTGVAANDEVWSFSFAYASGFYVLSGNGSSLVGYAWDGINPETLEYELQVLYGDHNVRVTYVSGEVSNGTLSVEFVLGLANMPISAPPSIDASGFTSGSASFSQIVEGYSGVQEVQVITLPANLVAGTWNVDGGGPIAWNADAAAVETYLDTVLGQTVSVTGDVGGPFTVTWATPGPQDLLDVESIDLQVPNSASVSTTQQGTVGYLAHFVYDSFGNVVSVKDGSGAAIANPSTITNVTYAGYTYNWSSKLYIMDHRLYDANVGQFISEDPSGPAGSGSNLYPYVGNSPTNLVDPTGLEEEPARQAFYQTLDQEGDRLANRVVHDWDPIEGALHRMRDALSNVPVLSTMSEQAYWYKRNFNENLKPFVAGAIAVDKHLIYRTDLMFVQGKPIEATQADFAASVSWLGNSQITDAAELANPITGLEKGRRLVNWSLNELHEFRADFGWVSRYSEVAQISVFGMQLPSDQARALSSWLDPRAARYGREFAPLGDAIVISIASEGLMRFGPVSPIKTPNYLQVPENPYVSGSAGGKIPRPFGVEPPEGWGLKINAAEAPSNITRPSPKSSLPGRVTGELPAGELRTPLEVAQARSFFERNRGVARDWWEQRSGEKWPANSTHDEHPRALKNGGDPLYVEPGFNGPNAPHMIPGPDGLTDFQRWGQLGGRPKNQ